MIIQFYSSIYNVSDSIPLEQLLLTFAAIFISE